MRREYVCGSPRIAAWPNSIVGVASLMSLNLPYPCLVDAEVAQHLHQARAGRIIRSWREDPLRSVPEGTWIP